MQGPREWYTNTLQVIAILGGTSFVVYQTFAGNNYTAIYVLDWDPYPFDFGFWLITLYAVHLVVSMGVWFLCLYVFIYPRYTRKLPVALITKTVLSK